MRISDWSSDVCSSDLHGEARLHLAGRRLQRERRPALDGGDRARLEDSRPRALRRAGQPQRVVERMEMQIGRASCRERVCSAVYISVCAVSLKKKKPTHIIYNMI